MLVFEISPGLALKCGYPNLGGLRLRAGCIPTGTRRHLVRCSPSSQQREQMKLNTKLYVTITALSLLRSAVVASRLSSWSTKLNPRPHQSCLQFIEYVPSTWEAKWLTTSKQPASSICKLMENDNSNAKTWIQELALPNPPQYTEEAPIWSFFKYRNVCRESSKDIVYVPIEPAVGLLRHPLATPCYPDSETPLDVQDRG